MQTTVDNNDIISKNNIRINGNSYDKNIKKINKKVKHYTCKRTDKKSKERKKLELKSNKDLTQPELKMMLNPIKIKENFRNNSGRKTLNISLNDNINQKMFKKQIKHLNNSSKNKNIPNQYYSSNTNNAPKIVNNFYSINNDGNCKIPIKVINVFN